MYKNRFIFLLFLTFFTSKMTAQTQKELEKMSQATIVDSFFVYENNFLKQLKYANLFFKNFKDDPYKVSSAYELYSMAYSNNKNYEKALFYINLSIKNCVDLPEKFHIMNAYWSKAVILSKLKKYDEAINNYVKAEQIAINNYPNYRYAITLNIGILKSEDLGETLEALKIFKKCYNFYKEDSNIKKYNDFYSRTLFAMADAYNSLEQVDSASYYNAKGYKNAKKHNDIFYLSLFTLNEGATQSIRKNYQATIDSINIVMPKLKTINNLENNILAAYYYYGKAYRGLKNDEKTIINFSRVDSIYQKTKIITPEFISGYHFLIKYYKNTGNVEKQLYYINTLMEIDSSHQKDYKVLLQKINKDYDIPLLVKEKENIINGLKGDKKINYYIISVLVLLTLGAVVFGYIQVKQKKKFKYLFDNLMVKSPQIVKPLDAQAHKAKEPAYNVDISEEIILDIKRKLKLFEKDKRYLNASISIHTLAQNFNTNTKYLSTIINYTFEKSFSNYVNDLRIDYIVQELKTNKNLRKYTISGIAEEAGFNNGESFAKAFFKRTGIKPSYFIKELNKI